MRISIVCSLILCAQFFGSITVFAQSDPIANLSASTKEGCIPLEIKFYNDSEGTVDSLRWTFQGGLPVTSSEEDPIVVFDEIGEFLVVLAAYGNGIVSHDTVYIETRTAKPKPAFRHDNDELIVSFENLTVEEAIYQWDFGDGNFSGLENPTHTYAAAGTYLVKLRATNDCTAAEYVDVVTVNLPFAPPAFTANDMVQSYEGYFRPGVNLGYFPPWNDVSLSDIAAGRPELGIKGAGVKSIRPGLFGSFIEQFGWDARVETYKHFDNIGLEDNTLIVGFPGPLQRDPTFYCPEHQSELFADLYEPIWDNGENGTPINDENDYAVYLYKIVNLKKDYIKFWEIWNEPGFDHTHVTGYLPPGEEGNWWENNPDPCDYKLRAPIFHYVRILRISYEIIKAIDPDSYVTLAAVGYPSFLDAVLRNTDNPNEGSINADYPLQGGAYFDAIGMHTYPHFDGTLSEWNNDIQDFDHFRHTDLALTTIPVTKASFESVLEGYGYDGMTYPEKEWIITEINVPRKQIGNYIGSEEAQINFLMKAIVECQRSGIREMHVFDMAESHYFEEATQEFHMMGFYQRLYSLYPYDQIINNGAMAFKTMSDQLFRATYDIDRSGAMNLPAGVDGAAFLNLEGQYVYVLWAQTSEDMSEEASATYSFPAAWNIQGLKVREWDASYSELSYPLGSQNIELSGTPLILTDEDNIFPVAPTPFFDFEVLDNCAESTVAFSEQSTENTDSWLWSFPGGSPATSTLPNPTVAYANAGTYQATLTVTNSEGSNSKTESVQVLVNHELPVADFSVDIFGLLISLSNNSSNATSYSWDIGDSNIFTENNPSHSYAVPGYYTITLAAINDCDTAYHSEDVIMLPEVLAPRPDFTADRLGACPNEPIQFQDLSTENSTSWYWILDGATPGISEEQNPLVTYENVGSYEVTLIAGNDAGTMTKYRNGFINISEAPVPEFTMNLDGSTVTFINTSEGAEQVIWEFGDGDFSNEFSPEHTYPAGGDYQVTLSVINGCDSLAITQTVLVEGFPSSQFTLGENAFCKQATIELVDESIGEVDSILWLMPGGSPTSSMSGIHTVNYATTGAYEITLIAWNSVGSDTLTRSIIILDDPIAQFSYDLDNGIYSFTNESQEGLSYHWDFGDGNESEEVAPQHDFELSGEYLVTLTCTNPCGSNTTSQLIQVVSEIDLTYDDAAIKIYPNPASRQFTIVGGYLSGEANVQLLDGLGQLVLQQRLFNNGGRISHNVYLQHLPAGLYFVKVGNGQRAFIEKLIIQ